MQCDKYLCQRKKICTDVSKPAPFICRMRSEVTEKSSKVKKTWRWSTRKALCKPQLKHNGRPLLNAWHKGISCNWTSGPESPWPGRTVLSSAQSLLSRSNGFSQLAPWFQSWCVSGNIHLSLWFVRSPAGQLARGRSQQELEGLGLSFLAQGELIDQLWRNRRVNPEIETFQETLGLVCYLLYTGCRAMTRPSGIASFLKDPYRCQWRKC